MLDHCFTVTAVFSKLRLPRCEDASALESWKWCRCWYTVLRYVPLYFRYLSAKTFWVMTLKNNKTTGGCLGFLNLGASFNLNFIQITDCTSDVVMHCVQCRHGAGEFYSIIELTLIFIASQSSFTLYPYSFLTRAKIWCCFWFCSTMILTRSKENGPPMVWFRLQTSPTDHLIGFFFFYLHFSAHELQDLKCCHHCESMIKSVDWKEMTISCVWK